MTSKSSTRYQNLIVTLFLESMTWVERLGRSRFISTLDLTKGFWQVSLAPEAEPMMEFTTTCAQVQYQIIPFGLHFREWWTLFWILTVSKKLHTLKMWPSTSPPANYFKGEKRPVRHISQKMSPAERKYAAVENKPSRIYDIILNIWLFPFTNVGCDWWPG